MGVEKISGFKYTCDNCGVVHEQYGSAGCYTNSTPDNWMRISIYWSTVNHAMRPETMLCDCCAKEAYEAMNGALIRRRVGRDKE